GHLFTMPYGRLPGEVFLACPNRRRPQGRPRTHWRDYVSRLARERLGVPLECEKQQADLVFLLDQSGSIVQKDYKIMKNFTVELVQRFNISQDKVRVGLAQFSSTFQHQLYLNDLDSEKEVVKHILNLVQLGGGTNIGHALNSLQEYFTAKRGSRRDQEISQNLVLITDGDSQDAVEDAAARLRTMGVEIFVIGVGHVHKLELLQITKNPERLFTVNDFGSLETIKTKVSSFAPPPLHHFLCSSPSLLLLLSTSFYCNSPVLCQSWRSL
uniref:VWFA domain-containing protein n=1 Tax=Periophthalmus magnuspinnatus TaxID=409849 RepID=A0A3B3Z794_9GOBI